MKRAEFLESIVMLSAAPAVLNLSDLARITGTYPMSEKMPVFFVGHGSPMNAITDNSLTRGWIQSVRDFPRPKAILCVSAHWETRGTWVTAMEKPRTIHDFGGFPQALFDVRYNAPGAPEYACMVQDVVTSMQMRSLKIG